MNKVTIREKAASFIDHIRQAVELKSEKEPGSFTFSTTVKEWDPVNKRGLICNPEGWLPDIMPDLAQWFHIDWNDKPNKAKNGGPTFVLNRKNPEGSSYCPHLDEIPMQKELWIGLNRTRTQYLVGESSVFPHATLNRVAPLWIRTSKRIRAGQLDHLLIFTTPVSEFIAPDQGINDFMKTLERTLRFHAGK